MKEGVLNFLSEIVHKSLILVAYIVIIIRWNLLLKITVKIVSI